MAVPIILLLMGIVSVQFGASYARGLFPVIGAEGTTALRLTLAAIMLAPVLRPWRARPRRRALPALLAYGVSLGFMNLLFYLSLRSVPLGIAVALEFSGPLAVNLGGARHWRDAVWIACAVIGLVFLLPLGHSLHAIDPRGAIMALGAGLCWAIYIVSGRRIGAELGTQAVGLGTIIGSIIALPIGLAHAGGLLFTPPMLLSGLVVALFSSAVPYTLDMIALTRLPPRLFGIVSSLDPVVGALMGLALLGQALSVVQWLAVVAVVAAAAGATATTRPEIDAPDI